MARPRGRPKNDPDEGKGEKIQIRLGLAEKDAFEAAAKLSGMSVSVWVRDRLRGVAQAELSTAGLPVPFLPEDSPIGAEGSSRRKTKRRERG